MHRADYSFVCHSCAVGGQNISLLQRGKSVLTFGVERPQEVKDSRKGAADGWRKEYHSGVARKAEW